MTARTSNGVIAVRLIRVLLLRLGSIVYGKLGFVIALNCLVCDESKSPTVQNRTMTHRKAQGCRATRASGHKQALLEVSFSAL